MHQLEIWKQVIIAEVSGRILVKSAGFSCSFEQHWLQVGLSTFFLFSFSHLWFSFGVDAVIIPTSDSDFSPQVPWLSSAQVMHGNVLSFIHVCWFYFKIHSAHYIVWLHAQLQFMQNSLFNIAGNVFQAYLLFLRSLK